MSNIEKAKKLLPIQNRDNLYKLKELNLTKYELTKIFSNENIIYDIDIADRAIVIEIKDHYTLRNIIEFINKLHAQLYEYHGDNIISFYFD